MVYYLLKIEPNDVYFTLIIFNLERVFWTWRLIEL